MDSTLPASGEARKASGRLAKTAAYYLAFVILGLTSASLGPTLPDLAANTRTQLSQVSYLFSARALGYLLGSLLGGRFYDRIPGHRVMVFGLLGMIVTLSLAPVIPLIWILVLDLLILGMGEGALDVGGNTLLVWVHRERVGPYMNALHFFWGLGAFLSPIIIAQGLLLSGGIQWGYWTLAALILLPTLWLIYLSSPAHPHQRQAEQSDQQPARVNYLVVFLIAMVLFLYVGAEMGFGGWIFTYTQAMGLSSKAVGAYLTSAYWGTLTVGRLLAIPIALRVRPRTVLLIDLLGSLVSLGIILAFPTSIAAIWIGSLTLGLFLASIFPTLITFAETRLTITGRVTSFFFVGSSLGGMFQPWLIGQLFEPVGPRVAMVIILIDVFLALMVYMVLRLNTTSQASRPVEEAG